MKEKKTIIILKFIFLSSITFYFLLSLIKSDLSYSKLTEDIMKDINIIAKDWTDISGWVCAALAQSRVLSLMRKD